MKMVRQEGGLPGRLPLGHELRDSLVLRCLGLNQSKTPKALDIGDGLQVEESIGVVTAYRLGKKPRGSTGLPALRISK